VIVRTSLAVAFDTMLTRWIGGIAPGVEPGVLADVADVGLS
jgi:hypothetical protein